MRRFALLLAAGGLVSWGVVAALEGCGGDADLIASPDGSTSNEAGTSSSGNGTSSGSSSGDPGDGGASSSGSAPTPNPGKITCGASECDAGGNALSGSVCCVRDAGQNPVCTRENQCDDDENLRLGCDEPADCTAFNQTRPCCLRLRNGGSGGIGGSSHRAECGGGFSGSCGEDRIPLCKTNADCGDAGTCSTKKCGDYTVNVCGNPENCN